MKLEYDESLKIKDTFIGVLEDATITDHEKDITNLIHNSLKIDGLELMGKIPDEVISTVFFDLQYRGILDKQKYGNEGKGREKRRVNLKQMTEKVIIKFIREINRVLKPSGHLFLWIDKFHLCEGTQGLDKLFKSNERLFIFRI